jgi:hypothetical protein
MTPALVVRTTLALIAGAGAAYTLRVANRRMEPDQVRSPVGTTAGLSTTDTQLVAVFLGSPDCSFSRSDTARALVANAMVHLRSQATERGWRFLRVGVAIARSPVEGARYLRSAGDFDEIATGNGWENLGAIRYFWNDLPGMPSTPQIVVTRRVIERSVGSMVSSRTVREEQLLARKAGLAELEPFVARRAPLPESRSVSRNPLSTNQDTGGVVPIRPRYGSRLHDARTRAWW